MRDRGRTLGVQAALAATYLVAGWLGLHLAVVHSSATPVWPPTGIAIAALMLGGLRLWPGVLVGAFLVNATTDAPLAAVAAIAVGNTLEAVAGAALVERLDPGPRTFDRPRGVLAFGLASVLAPMLAATIGASTLHLAGSAPASDLPAIWTTWWLGDVTGALIFAPAIACFGLGPRARWSKAKLLEALATLFGLVVVAEVVLGGLLPGDLHLPMAFACLPVLVWIAFRLGPLWTATGVVLLSLVGLAGTLRGTGAFGGGLPNESLLTLQAFVAVAALTSLATAAAVRERAAAQQALRESEERLRHSTKMEAIGRLAGGIAHDFNNLLTVIVGSNDLLLEALGREDPRRRDAEAVDQAAERAARLTRQLLAFARRQVLKPKNLSLGQVVSEMAPLLRRFLGEKIAVDVDVPAGLPAVNVDRSQLEQVVLNLALNARDAMPDGGRLVIEAGVTDVPPAGHAAREDGWITLRVADTGVGMDEATRTHAFEPFFTTKPGGSGFGLATVDGFVGQSGGHVAMASAPGAGTSFVVTLPAAGSPAEIDPPAAARPPPRGARILVVEDERVVRSVVAAMLQRQGHDVSQAADGVEALAMIDGGETDFEVVLTDVVMPRMGGEELSRRLAVERPELKIVFMSGYPGESRSLGERPIFLAKPFTAEVLAAKIGEALGASEPAASRHAPAPR